MVFSIMVRPISYWNRLVVEQAASLCSFNSKIKSLGYGFVAVIRQSISIARKNCCSLTPSLAIGF